MPRPKSTPNDQGEIIEAMKRGDRNFVWNKVKYVGYNNIPEIDERFMIFNKAFGSFNPYENNNFIMFYKTYLRYEQNNRADNTYYVTNNRSIINTLKNDFVSPSEENQKLIEDLKSFERMG